MTDPNTSAPRNEQIVVDSPPGETVLKAQNDSLGSALDIARRLYDKVKFTDLRSDRAAGLFVAGAAMLVREARREPGAMPESG